MSPASHPGRRWPTRAFAGLAIVILVAGACGSAATAPPTPSPGGSVSPLPEPETGFRLRATTVQALPPLSTFAWLPALLITDGLVAIQAGAVPAIYPGPLMTPLQGARLSEDGWSAIVAELDVAGLLSGATDFTGGTMGMGAAAGRLEVVVNGRVFDLTGDPSRVVRCDGQRCIPNPGTPEAFAAFWARLMDLPGWLGGAVGPQEPWTPVAYAVLVGPPPAEDAQLPQPVLAWPLTGPSSGFGDPVLGDPTLRCGTVADGEAASLGAAVAAANQLTRWRDPAAPDVPEALLGLTVRPLLPGDSDPCAPLVGR